MGIKANRIYKPKKFFITDFSICKKTLNNDKCVTTLKAEAKCLIRLFLPFTFHKAVDQILLISM